MQPSDVLLILAVVGLFAAWLWVKNRDDDDGDAPGQVVEAVPARPFDMGFHRPVREAIA